MSDAVFYSGWQTKVNFMPIGGSVMDSKQWIVNYSHKDGRTGHTVIEWPNEPSAEIAASRIRDHLLGENYLLVDIPRGHSEPSAYLLQSYGYEIGEIVELKD